MQFKVSTAYKLSADIGAIEKAADLIPVMTESVVLSVSDIRVKPELQYRFGSTEVHGFHVKSSRIDEMAEFVVQRAIQGVRSEDAFPAVTIGRNGDETPWLAGGHHRCAAIRTAKDWAETDKLPMSVVLLHGGGNVDARKIAELIGNVRADIYEVACEEDFRVLAGRENGNTQHGEKLTSKEKRAVIERGFVQNPRIAQLSDNAAAVVLTGSTSTRGTVQTIRKALVKAGKVDDVKERIGLDGTFKKVRRPGSVAIDAMNAAASKLEAETAKVQGIIDALHENERLAPAQLRSHARCEAQFASKLEAASKWLNAEEQEKAAAFAKKQVLVLPDTDADAPDADAPEKPADAKPVTEKPVDAKPETPAPVTEKPADAPEAPAAKPVTEKPETPETSEEEQEAAKLGGLFAAQFNGKAQAPNPKKEEETLTGEEQDANTLSVQARGEVALLTNLHAEFESLAHRAADAGVHLGDAGEAIVALFHEALNSAQTDA